MRLADIRLISRYWTQRWVTLFAVVTTMSGSAAVSFLLFASLDGIWLRAVPYPNPQSLVAVQRLDPDIGRTTIRPSDISYWKAFDQIFQELAAFESRVMDVGGPLAPQQMRVALVQPEFFSALQERPFRGRLLQESDLRAATKPVLLAFDFWRSTFTGADPLGSVILLNGERCIVVGVLPSRASEIISAQIVTVLREVRYTGSLNVIARLRPGITATAAMTALSGPNSPDESSRFRTQVVPLRNVLAGEKTGELLVVLLLVTGLVQLAAAANASIVLVLAGERRRHDVAIQLVLGARRLDIGRQILLETSLFAVIGTAIGLVVAFWSQGWLIHIAPLTVLRANRIAVDTRIVTGGVCLAFLIIAMVATVPYINVSSLNPIETLGGRRINERRRNRITSALLAAEVGLAAAGVLLASLCTSQLQHLVSQDIGFDPSDVVTFRAKHSGSPAPIGSAATLGVLTAMAGIAGVETSAGTDMLPFSGARAWYTFRPSERDRAQPDLSIDLRRVTPGYFQTLRIPLKAGRYFTDDDRIGSEPVAIVNEQAVRRFWGGQNPIDRTLTVSSTSGTVQIVGIVGNVKHTGFDGELLPELYRPWAQEPHASLVFVARVTGKSRPFVIEALTRKPSFLGASVEPTNVRLMDEFLMRSTARERFSTTIVTILTVVACVVALLGVVAVSGNVASKRKRETFIRSALGAQVTDIVRALALPLLMPIIMGTLVGVLAASSMMQILRAFIVDLPPTVGISRGGLVCAVVICAASLAAIIPLWRSALSIETLKRSQ